MKLPCPHASWDQIQRFALTFDGYKHFGSFERCAAIANRRRDGEGGHENLSELRGCLFFGQRRWHRFGDTPDAEAMSYIWHGAGSKPEHQRTT